jgi:hypothetical protein
MWVAHIDTRIIIKDAKTTRNVQHADTIAALNKTDQTITALRDQARALTDQAAALKGQLEALRAIVAPKGFNKGTTVLGGIQLKTWTAIWTNTGNTATKNLIIYSYCYWTNGEDNFVFPLPGLPDLLIPRGEVYGRVCIPGNENLDKVRHGDGRFFIIGNADYDDIFGSPHTTQFCAELLPNNSNSETDYMAWNCLGASRRDCTDSACPGFSSGR